MRYAVLLFLVPFLLPRLSAQPDLTMEDHYEVFLRNFLEELYLDLHRAPELSFYEYKTAERLANELYHLCDEVHMDVGGTGVVGILRNGEGPTILLRADMDALPIIEETGLPYASTVTTTDEAGNTVGVMHACGHDVHMSVLIGTAMQLNGYKDKWKGTVIFLCQPAEERSGGAKAMLGDGLYERFPVPDYALALHVNSSLPAGTVGYCPEYMMANVDMMDITVFGEGGHGAYPEKTKDPVVLAARIVMALQTIVSREIDPQQPAVVTVGAINGGTKGNIIPGAVTLQLTMRSYSDEVRNAIIEKIERICLGVAISAGLPEDKYPEVVLRDEYTPALYNDPELCRRVVNVFEKEFGDDKVVAVAPSMVGEDFGRYGITEEDVPIFMFWLGAVPEDRMRAFREEGVALPSLHSATFYPDYNLTIETGVRAMTKAVLDLFNK